MGVGTDDVEDNSGVSVGNHTQVLDRHGEISEDCGTGRGPNTHTRTDGPVNEPQTRRSGPKTQVGTGGVVFPVPRTLFMSNCSLFVLLK